MKVNLYSIKNLIGIKKHIVEQCFDVECHEILQDTHNGCPVLILSRCRFKTFRVRTVAVKKFSTKHHKTGTAS